jgi:uncharacterized OsmC-like protein
MSSNGVDTRSLFATIDAVKADSELAQFLFRASNRWVSGTHNVSTVNGYYGAKQEFRREAAHRYDADHPPVLCGSDEGPTPVEFVLHALAACLTSALANIAAARGIPLTEVTSTVEGDMDLRGILGISPDVRNGFQAIRVNFVVRADAPPEQLDALVAQARKRSAVFDILTNGVPVTVDVKAG